jgi:alpha-L-fucosidase
MMAAAKQINANLLLHTGPLPDGSIHPEDVNRFREVGKRRRSP